MKLRISIALLALASLSGAQEIRRGTADSNATVASSACAGTNQATSSGGVFLNWYDASGNTTSGIFTAFATTGTGAYKAHKVTGWVAASGAYSALNLIVESSSGSDSNNSVQYSINAGSTWTTIRAGSGWSRIVDSVALTAAQDLSLLQVRACGSTGPGTIDTPSAMSVTLWDIRTEGTLNTGGPGILPYVPNTTISEITDNNTSSCATTNAASVGPTGCANTFPGAGQTVFPVSTSNRSGTAVTIKIVDNYNFSTTDKVIVSGLGGSFTGGTYQITSLGACSSSGAADCTITYTQGSGTASSTGGTATRFAQTEPFVPAPRNVANFVNDGVDPHLLPFLGGTGGTSAANICPHFMLWFATNGSAGNAIFTPVDGTTSADLDHGLNISNGSHSVNGYSSNSANQVAAQINAMKRLNFDCLIADAYGLPINGISTQRTLEIGTLNKVRDNLAGQSAFQFAAFLDDATFNTGASCGTLSVNGHPQRTPSCVEKMLQCGWDYYHYNTTQTFTCPFDGLTYSGGGHFSNTAYLTLGGKPVTGTFMNENSYFSNDTSGGVCGTGSGGQPAPCAVYNNGTAGVTCTSPSDCWNKIYAGIAAHQSAWTTKPIYCWRNSFTAHAVGATVDQCDYRWINPTGDRTNTDFPAYDADVTTSKSSTRHFVATAYAHNDHSQSSFQNDNLGMEGYCGKTFMQSFARPNQGSKYTAAVGNDLELYQLITWNDVEQGTVIENGIDTCYSLNGATTAIAADGHTLNWALQTSDATNAPLSPLNSTLHHISIYVSIDGVNAMKLPDLPATATGSIDLDTFNLEAHSYTVYVRLVPWTDMFTDIKGPFTYGAITLPPTPTPGTTVPGTSAHRGTLISKGAAWPTPTQPSGK